MKGAEENRILWFTAICILAIVIIAGAVIVGVQVHNIQNPDDPIDIVGEAYWSQAISSFSSSCSEQDNGIDYPKFSKISGFDNNKYIRSADECVDSRTLKEWYCKDSGRTSVPTFTFADCPALFGKSSECRDGECT